MKKLPILSALIVMLLFAANIHAQTKFGNATMEELQMTTYPEDTTTTAVILLKKGTTYFTYDYNLYGFQRKQTIEMKIKILKPEGLKWCTDEISYRDHGIDKRERIDGLSGTTYNLENGKIVKTKLSKEFISEESVDDKLKVRKFTMPAAKVGSVIEYKYNIVSDFFYIVPDFWFQTSIPTAEVFYEITLPEYFRFNKSTVGYERLALKTEPANERFRVGTEYVNCNADRFTFTGKNISALRNEDHLWTIEDYRSKVTFEISSIQMPFSRTIDFSTTWPNIDKEFFGSGTFSSNLKKTGLFKDEIKPMETNLVNAHEILNIVKYKVKWNEKNQLYPTNLNDALKTGLGSSADMNFLLINALKAGGFNASPVLISTRSNGRVPITHPSASAFNYVITALQIDTLTYFTDASSKYSDWNILPEKCMVTQGRLLNETDTRWVDLSTLSTGSTYINAQYEFVEGKLQGQISEERKGNAAIDFKNFYFGHKDKDEYIEKKANHLSCQIKDFDIQNELRTDVGVKASYTLHSDVTTGDEYLYINPLLVKHISDNPFKNEKRIFPVNFDHIQSYVQIVEINIPEGYAVEELPKSERFMIGDGSPIRLVFHAAQVDNKIKIHYQYVLKSLLFLPSDYEILKEFFGKIVLKNSEQIVLKKISEA